MHIWSEFQLRPLQSIARSVKSIIKCWVGPMNHKHHISEKHFSYTVIVAINTNKCVCTTCDTYVYYA